jgi:hypothetical protein
VRKKTEKCKSISFSRGSKPVMFQYVIGDSDLESVDVINDLGVLVDSRMTFVNHDCMYSMILHVQDVVCGFCPAGFGVCIVRVVASS